MGRRLQESPGKDHQARPRPVTQELDRDAGDGPDEPTGEPDSTADASLMTEGIGGMADLEPEERATISDVDGDNVETERPKPQI